MKKLTLILSILALSAVHLSNASQPKAVKTDEKKTILEETYPRLAKISNPDWIKFNPTVPFATNFLSIWSHWKINSDESTAYVQDAYDEILKLNTKDRLSYLYELKRFAQEQAVYLDPRDHWGERLINKIDQQLKELESLEENRKEESLWAA